MVRILVVTSRYPPHSWGGYGLLCRDVVRRWRERGHDVEVLASDRRREHPPERDDDSAVLRTLRTYLGGHDPAPSGWTGALATERHNRRMLREHLERSDPDVVSFWNLGGTSVTLPVHASRWGYPVVLVLGDDWLRWGHRADGWTRRFRGRGRRAFGALTGLAVAPGDLGPASAACFASRYLLEGARDSRWRIAHRAVIPHGVDVARFAAARRDRSGWGRQLLFVGRLDPRKGADTIVRVLPRLPGWDLTIVGGDEMGARAELTRLAGDLGVGDRIRFDERPHAELPAVYADADVLIVPSRWQEPFGLAPLEALAAGVPVVATRTGGSGEFLVDGSSCLGFAPDDGAGLVAALERLERDPRLRARLRETGYRVAGWLDVERTADGLERWHVAAAERFVAGAPPGRTVLPPEIEAATRAAEVR